MSVKHMNKQDKMDYAIGQLIRLSDDFGKFDEAMEVIRKATSIEPILRKIYYLRENYTDEGKDRNPTLIYDFPEWKSTNLM